MATRNSRRLIGLTPASILLSIGFTLTLATADAGASWLSGQVPCPDHGQNLAPDNQQVLQWKQSEPNGYLARAHVLGYVTGLEPGRNGHDHFIIQIGKGPRDVIEVVYNMEFGQLPQLQNGMQVEACGDFIQSYSQNGPYPPSPAGAIIHWVHMNPNQRPGAHDSGYLIINGQQYGNDLRNVRPLPNRNRRGFTMNSGYNGAYSGYSGYGNGAYFQLNQFRR